MKKQEIRRSDGIIYQREIKKANYDCSLTIRFSRTNIEKLKEIAKSENIKYNALARKVLEKYIEERESIVYDKERTK